MRFNELLSSVPYKKVVYNEGSVFCKVWGPLLEYMEKHNPVVESVCGENGIKYLFF